MDEELNQENVDITTEDVAVEETVTKEVQDTPTETPAEKTFTQEQLDKIVKERVDRAAKAESRKYGKIIKALQKGTGTKNLNELQEVISNYYGQDNQQPFYDDEDEEILANAEAQKIIDLGYDEIVTETNNLMNKGDLSLREKFLYKRLAETRKDIEQTNELKSIGVNDDVIQSKEFQSFKNKFNDTTSLKDVYELYSQLNPPEEVKPIGSMKTESSKDDIKTYYSPEDFDKLTPEQLDDPRVMEAVENSMAKWRK